MNRPSLHTFVNLVMIHMHAIRKCIHKKLIQENYFKCAIKCPRGGCLSFWAMNKVIEHQRNCHRLSSYCVVYSVTDR